MNIEDEDVLIFENVSEIVKVVDVDSISSYEYDNQEENRKDTSVKKILVV
jgi:hypothetical protein